jgi:glycerophosphoryl diester phosphodiesterase
MRASSEPPLLLDELVQIMRTGPTHPSALVQLDLYGEIDTAAEKAFAVALRGVAQGFILSGYDWDVVSRVGSSVAGLTLGYDPTEDAERSGANVLRIVREKAPGAAWIYLRRDLVRASYERGDRIVARLRVFGHQVDCWTIDHGTPGHTADFVAAVMAGCDQVTTNTAAVWANPKLVA